MSGGGCFKEYLMVIKQLFPLREQCDADLEVSVHASWFMWEQTQGQNHVVLNTAEINHLIVLQDWFI